MRTPERAYRDVEIMLARVAGATYPEIRDRFGITERQAKRIVRRFSEEPRWRTFRQAIELGYQRRRELADAVREAASTIASSDNPFVAAGALSSMACLAQELRVVEELLGLAPRQIEWEFDQDAAASLWQRFKTVLKRHPGAWDALYLDLFRTYEDWAEWHIDSQLRGGRRRGAPPA